MESKSNSGDTVNLSDTYLWRIRNSLGENERAGILKEMWERPEDARMSYEDKVEFTRKLVSEYYYLCDHAPRSLHNRTARKAIGMLYRQIRDRESREEAYKFLVSLLENAVYGAKREILNKIGFCTEKGTEGGIPLIERLYQVEDNFDISEDYWATLRIFYKQNCPEKLKTLKKRFSFSIYSN